MKKTFVLGLLFVLLFTSCSQNIAEKHFIGTWKLVKLTGAVKGLPSAIMDAAREEALSRTYILKEGNILHLESKNIGEVEGKWAYHLKTNILELTYNSTKTTGPEKYKIEKLSATEMEWSQNIRNEGQMQMLLKKE